MSTAKELKELAKQKGMKYFSRMSKKELCEKIGIELPQKPTKITLENTVTKEVLKFPSIYRASKEIVVVVVVVKLYLKSHTLASSTLSWFPRGACELHTRKYMHAETPRLADLKPLCF